MRFVVGRYPIDLDQAVHISASDVMRACPDVQPGGTWRPRDCAARHRVLIVIPYRDRKQHLLTLLYYLHPLLQRQQLDYRIVVAEQVRASSHRQLLYM